MNRIQAAASNTATRFMIGCTAIVMASMLGLQPARAALPVEVDGEPLPSLAPVLEAGYPGRGQRVFFHPGTGAFQSVLQ